MPRACSLLRLLHGDIIAFSLFLPIELLGGSRKKYITAAVEGGFDGVLNDTDDETDGYRLHGDIIADTEERASHRDKEQRTTGNTRSATSTEGSNHTQQERRSKRHFTQIRGKRNLENYPYTARELAQQLRFKTVAAAVRQRINGPTREQDLIAYHASGYAGTFRQWLFQQELAAYDAQQGE